MAHAPAKPVPAPLSAPPIPSVADEQLPLVLRLPEQWALTDECMILLGESNEALGFERTAEGALQINFPPGNLNSERGGIIYAQILNWGFAADTGRATPADGGVHLPDGLLLVPDAMWISDERLAEIDVGDEGIWSVVPDFVLEVRSRSQDIKDQQGKMEQWMANGVRLGWLIDPFEAQVWIYRTGQDEPELLERPASLSGEDVMVGLTVDLTRVWPADSD